MRIPGWRWQCQRDGCWMEKCKVDFSHFEDLFPRGINFSDTDGLVELNGKFLIQEWKYPDTILPKGQRIMFERFTQIDGNAVLIIEGYVAQMQPITILKIWNGSISKPVPATLDTLREIISGWAAIVSQ